MVADLSPPMLVENIQLKLKQKIKTEGKHIRGCSLLHDDRMVISCSDTNTVSFINKEEVELFQIGKNKTGTCTYDTVYIKDNKCVAVSSGRGNIAIIDIESLKVMTTISMVTDIYGMAIRCKTIYYCTPNSGLKMLNLTDKSISDITNNNMLGVLYVATSGDKLFYTNTHTVTCCDLHGATQWKFKDKRILQCPRDISVDNDGNVYVVGNRSNNVVVISPDGQRHRKILSFKDGLSYPFVLDYDRSTNRLLVVNDNSAGFLFNVTRGQ